VVSVSDGEDAVARIAGERPDIVMADVAMPKRNGYEVAAFVKGRPELAHIPVLLLAGALEPVDQARAAASRCDGVLVKPLEPQQVIARVRELIGGARRNPAHVVAGVPRPIDRVVEPRHASGPTAAALTPAAKQGATDDALANYFDQLGAAFEQIDAGAGRSALAHFDSESEDDTARLEVPTLNSVIGRPAQSSPKEPVLSAAPSVESPDIRPVPPPPRDAPMFRTGEPAHAPSPLAPDSHRRAAADPFEALIAADEADRQAKQAAAEPVQGVPPALGEQLIETVAARVIERLAPEGIDHLVSRIVSEVAERLVREEIDRIRGRK
jgi:CheY-like chemotaxis protein